MKKTFPSLTGKLIFKSQEEKQSIAVSSITQTSFYACLEDLKEENQGQIRKGKCICIAHTLPSPLISVPPKTLKPTLRDGSSISIQTVLRDSIDCMAHYHHPDSC